MKARIVTLCGSTRFGRAFEEAELSLTLLGCVVLTIGCNLKSDAELFAHLPTEKVEQIKRGLDVLHLEKIDLSDEIFVLNVQGYIGESTRAEIEYAERTGKIVRYLYPYEV